MRSRNMSFLTFLVKSLHFNCGSPNQNWKMVLQEKLRGTKMMKTYIVTSFLTIFS
jgi:hypothetical protein